MNIKLLTFDLDGTLLRSANNIYIAAVKALERLNIPAVFTKEEFDGVIGHNFKDTFRLLNQPAVNLEEFLPLYKSYYMENIDKSEFYPGVTEVLTKLKNRNLKLALLTTKMQDQAEEICGHFKIDSYFDVLMGWRKGMERKPSAEPLSAICSQMNISPADALMIGDSEMDIQCGKNAGTFSCGVTYGYRKKEILERENPDFLIDNILELENILFREIKK